MPGSDWHLNGCQWALLRKISDLGELDKEELSWVGGRGCGDPVWSGLQSGMPILIHWKCFLLTASRLDVYWIALDCGALCTYKFAQPPSGGPWPMIGWCGDKSSWPLVPTWEHSDGSCQLQSSPTDGLTSVVTVRQLLEFWSGTSSNF